MKNTILLIIVFSFLIGCDKKAEKIEELSVKILSYKKVDSANYYCILSFENNSFKNYVLPAKSQIYLLSTKNGIVGYHDLGKIEGKIVSSDFVDYAGGANSNESIKVQQVINKYFESTWPPTIDLGQFWNNNFEGFVHSLLFMPKKSNQKVIVWFHAFDINQNILTNKKSRISIFSNEQGDSNNLNKIDSLLKINKIDYRVYRKLPSLKDSLLVNK
jgi:hypothetical protein